MKRFVSLIAAVLLILSCAIVPGSAYETDSSVETIPSASAKKTKAMQLKIKYSEENPDVYYVTVSYGDMLFQYGGGGWDPLTHSFSASSDDEASYTQGENVLKITNRSNRDIYYSFRWSGCSATSQNGDYKSAKNNGIVANLNIAQTNCGENNAGKLLSAYDIYKASSDSITEAGLAFVTGTVTLSGTMTEEEDTNFSLSVTLSPNAFS